MARSGDNDAARGTVVRLLGQLDVVVDGHVVELNAHRERVVFAVLALEAGRTVSVDRLVDELWPVEPPDNAVATVRVYVSRIRKALQPVGVRISTRSGGCS